MQMKDQELRNVFKETFSDSFRQNLWPHIAVNFLPDQGYSAFFLSLFTDIVAGILSTQRYILGVIVKFNLSVEFFLHSFEWFCLQINSDINYFCVFSNALWLRITVYCSQIWNRKEHNLLSSRVISSQMGPTYTDTPVELTQNKQQGILNKSNIELSKNRKLFVERQKER